MKPALNDKTRPSLFSPVWAMHLSTSGQLKKKKRLVTEQVTLDNPTNTKSVPLKQEDTTCWSLEHFHVHPGRVLFCRKHEAIQVLLKKKSDQARRESRTEKESWVRKRGFAHTMFHWMPLSGIWFQAQETKLLLNFWASSTIRKPTKAFHMIGSTPSNCHSTAWDCLKL